MNNTIYLQTKAVIEELHNKAGLKPGSIVVVGCSTSEVLGSKIGTNSNPETAKKIFEALYDYAKKQGIHLAKKLKKLVFTVEDQGSGLSEEAQKHIFDKFYQADASHKQEGNGLGLALVKRILTIEKGQITAENIPEGGCRFTVTLRTK